MDFRTTRARSGKTSRMALLMAVLVLWATVSLGGGQDLISAAYYGDLAEVKRLLAAGARVNAPPSVGLLIWPSKRQPKKLASMQKDFANLIKT